MALFLEQKERELTPHLWSPLNRQRVPDIWVSIWFSFRVLSFGLGLWLGWGLVLGFGVGCGVDLVCGVGLG